MKRLVAFGVVVAALVCFSVSGRTQARDIVETAVAAGNFTTLAKLLTDAELVAVMKSPGPFTVFAPTDEAFAKVPKATLDALAKDKAKLRAVLQYHVLTSKLVVSDLALVKRIGSVLGPALTFTVKGSEVTVNDAKVLKSNIDCANGVIHVIDTVLIPPQ